MGGYPQRVATMAPELSCCRNIACMGQAPGTADRILRALDRAWNARESEVLRASFRAAAALLMPVPCVGCGRPDLRLCQACARALQRSARRPVRVEAAAEALPLNECGEPMPVVAAGKYEHELASVLLNYKNHQMVALGKVLMPLLASALHSAIEELTDPGAPVLLVPVPTRRQARATRGYWPVGMLLHRVEAAHLLPNNVRVARLLGYGARASWGRSAQKGQGRRGRALVHNTMKTRATPGTKKLFGADAQVLLVDDVLTTGATLAEAHRVVVHGGLVCCGAVVVAGTPAPNEERELGATR